jgi:hypothetical protein
MKYFNFRNKGLWIFLALISDFKNMQHRPGGKTPEQPRSHKSDFVRFIAHSSDRSGVFPPGRNGG